MCDGSQARESSDTLRHLTPQPRGEQLGQQAPCHLRLVAEPLGELDLVLQGTPWGLGPVVGDT